MREFEEGTPSVVLLEATLPDVCGFDVCRDIRKAGLRVPIIILSAKTEEIDVVVGLEIGADDYITKPFRARELLARIAAHLRKARQEERGASTRAGWSSRTWSSTSTSAGSSTTPRR